MSSGRPLTPQRVAHLRADFVERAENPLATQLLWHIIKQSRDGGSTVFPPEYNGADLAHDMVLRARKADLWTATPEMMELILDASEKMPPQVLHRADLPSMTGFLVLPNGSMKIKPLPNDEEADPEPIPVHAIMWDEVSLGGRPNVPGDPPPKRGIVVNLLTESGYPKADARFYREMPELFYLHTQGVAFGINAWDLSEPERDGNFRASQKFVNRLHLPHEILTDKPNKDGAYLIRDWQGKEHWVTPDPLIQFLSAYWHFADSILTDLERIPIKRSSHRWLTSLNLPLSPVTVVRLRRRERVSTGTGAALTYRHVRRGHWRLQWVGSEKEGTRRQKAIWINPTVVGDESLPLRVRDVVNIVSR
jgi:hypothetical protein